MRFVLRRLGFFVLTLWAALTLNFFIPRFMPGSPLQALRDRTHNKLSPAAADRAAAARSASSRTRTSSCSTSHYLSNMVTGHWGFSIGGSLGEPVTPDHRAGAALDARPGRRRHGPRLRCSAP